MSDNRQSAELPQRILLTSEPESKLPDFLYLQRLQGKKVTFITGTDEHGEKIATSAAAAGKEPKEFVDSIAEEYKSLWHDLDISYDTFVRTTSDNHEKVRAKNNGEVMR
jgi:methionyl-tRNA synthetase